MAGILSDDFFQHIYMADPDLTESFVMGSTSGNVFLTVESHSLPAPFFCHVQSLADLQKHHRL
jgi:hypothetical protein